MRVRNRAVILFLLPVTILLWLIGWILYWTSSQNKSQTPKTKTETHTPIATTILLEDHEEAKA
jgi:uncharacterized membrane protein